MPNSARKTAAVLPRIILAVLFAVSAVAKLMAIDDFELYLFSYGFFPLDVTFVLVRLCIGTELALGLLLALGWWKRPVWLLTTGLLLFFCLFLCYAALSGRNESCQCFGRLADMPPAVSLLKNAALLVLLILYRWSERRLAVVAAGEGGRRQDAARWRLPVTVALLLAALAVPFVVSVPDNWMFGAAESRYDHEAFQAAVAPDGVLAADSLGTGSHLVAFVTPGCPYCRMSREKIASIASRHRLDTNNIHFYEPSDLPDGLFLTITYGQRPLILLLSDGNTVATYHYRNIDERQISRVLGKR